MPISIKDVIMSQHKGLNAILDNAKVTVSEDGKSVALFSILDAEAAETLFRACAQLDDCELEEDEQDLSHSHAVCALPPDQR
nr:hypothetical protein [uncultured Cohaesibacter sp.]